MKDLIKIIAIFVLAISLSSCENKKESKMEQNALIIFINGKGYTDNTYQTCADFRSAYNTGWRPAGWEDGWKLTGCTENDGTDGITFYTSEGEEVIFEKLTNDESDK